MPDFKFDSPVKGYLVIDGEGSSDILQGKIHSIKRILAYKRKNWERLGTDWFWVDLWVENLLIIGNEEISPYHIYLRMNFEN